MFFLDPRLGIPDIADDDRICFRSRAYSLMGDPKWRLRFLCLQPPSPSLSGTYSVLLLVIMSTTSRNGAPLFSAFSYFLVRHVNFSSPWSVKFDPNRTDIGRFVGDSIRISGSFRYNGLLMPLLRQLFPVSCHHSIQIWLGRNASHFGVLVCKCECSLPFVPLLQVRVVACGVGTVTVI
jgi:hypothetical protein